MGYLYGLGIDEMIYKKIYLIILKNYVSKLLLLFFNDN